MVLAELRMEATPRARGHRVRRRAADEVHTAGRAVKLMVASIIFATAGGIQLALAVRAWQAGDSAWGSAGQALCDFAAAGMLGWQAVHP